MDREQAHTEEQAARKVYSAAIAEASEAKRAAVDLAHRERDLGHDRLRDLRAELLRARPRDEPALAVVENAMRDWKRNPPAVDLSEAQASYQRAARAADHELDTELKAIRTRLRAGALDPVE